MSSNGIDFDFYNQLQAMIKIENMGEEAWKKIHQCACKLHEKGTDSFGKCLAKCCSNQTSGQGVSDGWHTR
jgi:hypothetical protein